jgi:aryl-alcohol dehydrogenase-like predicted oxidoreductase
MQQAPFGPLGVVSRLTLGGGGIGQGWGETSREEARATLIAAVDAGIDLIDSAPIYANCEAIIGETFGGAPPAHVRFTTKCALATPAAGTAYERLSASLIASLQAMRLERVDIFFLHSNICPDDFEFEHARQPREAFATTWSSYVADVAPAFQRLKDEGRIGAWGITGIGVPGTVIEALSPRPTGPPRPDFTQAITNLLDSAGGIRRFAEPARPRDVIAAANRHGVTVMGIRAVQAGALTHAIDRTTSTNHPETRDFARAAPFRALCARLGEDPAVLAQRYALSLPGVATVVLGVKNRTELGQCLRAEADGPLSEVLMADIDGLGLKS